MYRVGYLYCVCAFVVADVDIVVVVVAAAAVVRCIAQYWYSRRMFRAEIETERHKICIYGEKRRAIIQQLSNEKFCIYCVRRRAHLDGTHTHTEDEQANRII